MSCPICDQKSDPRYRPFCSRRCADLDLGNWLTGRYSLPSDELEDTQDQMHLSPNSDPKLH